MSAPTGSDSKNSEPGQRASLVDVFCLEVTVVDQFLSLQLSIVVRFTLSLGIGVELQGG